MRMYFNPLDAVREVERDLWEMGIDVHPETMQDKDIADNPDYATKELQAYGFQIDMTGVPWGFKEIRDVVNYVSSGKRTEELENPDQYNGIGNYIATESSERIDAMSNGTFSNPGLSHGHRMEIWEEFLHNGKFAYTYTERIAPQGQRIIDELTKRPSTRQAIINLHSNICPVMTDEELQVARDPSSYEQPDEGIPGYVDEVGTPVVASVDLRNMGGSGRIPCSMYYQFMNRRDKLDMIYTMRSCDFITHFPVDISVALDIQAYVAHRTKTSPGVFTYFTGSLHAYAKDLKTRGIF